ncbi:zinc finger and BTB domain-containing protein 6 isoform X2 [Latimeria chalumnae]
MAADSEILHFKLEQQGEAMLQKMNLLREQNLFCDVSVYINNLEFNGHKVVLAACSTYMRDQFLLNHSKKVQINILQNAEIGKQLLLSCYTGFLQIKKIELLNYLTAASYLQMGHIVEKCTYALSRYLGSNPSTKGKPQRSQTSCSATEIQKDKDFASEDISESLGESDNPSVLDFRVKQENLQILKSTYKNIEMIDKRFGNADLSECNLDETDDEICVVKVESITNDVSDTDGDDSQINKPCTSSFDTVDFPETQQSVINSTVEMKMSEMSENYVHDTIDEPTGVQVLSLVDQAMLGNIFSMHEGGILSRHQCPKCPRVFRQLENYIRHLKMHKLFLCLQCGKTFTMKKNLNRHMRGHMGIRPYECTICLKTFTAKSTLRDHINIHSGDRPYKCTFCDMDFKQKSVLKKHLSSVHRKSALDNTNGGNLSITIG